MFAAGSAAPLRLVRLFEGELPAGARRRKAAKPDLESLVALPATSAAPSGALLALGSGSRPNRCIGRAARARRARRTARHGTPDRSRSAVCRRWRAHVGCAQHRGRVLRDRRREWVAGPAAAWRVRPGQRRDPVRPGRRDDLARGTANDGAATRPHRRLRSRRGRWRRVRLHRRRGAPDGAWLFSAVAEQSDNSYDDGACRGAALGIVDRDGTLRGLHALSPTRKVEGVAASVVGDSLLVSMVTDADDPKRPALLGATTLPLRR